MSNVEIDDRAARRNALDAFAEAPMRTPSNGNDIAQIMPMASTERVFGAQQVAVYRDEARVLQKISALGAAAGDDWFYRFPVKSKGGQKSFIEGPSIKLANDVARIYGNCEVDVRVIDLGSSWLIYARFIDFESGFAMTRPFQQNKGGSKLGGDDDARRLDIAFQIGVSKAIRNVTVNALQTYADYAFEAAKNSLVEKIGKDVQKWREQMKVRLGDRGVDVQRVEYVIGRAVADWTAPDIARVIAMMKAIADGMATLDETFPPKERQTRDSVDADTGEITEGAVAMQADADAKAATAKTQPLPETSPPAGEAAATAEAAPDSSASKASGAAKAPSTEKEYEAYAAAWIDALTDVGAGETTWKADKSLRNKANVSEEVREALKAKLDKKIAEIRDADTV